MPLMILNGTKHGGIQVASNQGYFPRPKLPGHTELELENAGFTVIQMAGGPPLVINPDAGLLIMTEPDDPGTKIGHLIVVSPAGIGTRFIHGNGSYNVYYGDYDPKAGVVREYWVWDNPLAPPAEFDLVDYNGAYIVPDWPAIQNHVPLREAGFGNGPPQQLFAPNGPNNWQILRIDGGQTVEVGALHVHNPLLWTEQDWFAKNEALIQVGAISLLPPGQNATWQFRAFGQNSTYDVTIGHQVAVPIPA